MTLFHKPNSIKSLTKWGFMQTNSPAKTRRVYKLLVYGSNDSLFENPSSAVADSVYTGSEQEI